jgi:hypothetical protein
MQEHNAEQENTSHHAERTDVVWVRTWNETFIFCVLQWSHRNLKQKEEKNMLLTLFTASKKIQIVNSL